MQLFWELIKFKIFSHYSNPIYCIISRFTCVARFNPPKRISADFLCIFSIKPVDYAIFTGSLSLWKTCISCLRAENLVVIQDRVFPFLSLGSFQKINRTCSRKNGRIFKELMIQSFLHSRPGNFDISQFSSKIQGHIPSVEKGIDAESNILHIVSEK